MADGFLDADRRLSQISGDPRSTEASQGVIMATYPEIWRSPRRVAEGGRVNGDIELPSSQTPDTAHPGRQRSAEQAMRATIIKSVAVSVPLSIAIFIGLVALAVHNQHPDWNAYLAMAAGIGVVAGVFFGLLMGFTLTSHNFE